MTYDLIHQVTYQGRTGSVAVYPISKAEYYDYINSMGYESLKEIMRSLNGYNKVFRATKSLQLPVGELVIPKKEDLKFIDDYVSQHYFIGESPITRESMYRMLLNFYKSTQSAGCYTAKQVLEAVYLARQINGRISDGDPYKYNYQEILNTLHPLPKTLTIEGGKESWGW